LVPSCGRRLRRAPVGAPSSPSLDLSEVAAAAPRCRGGGGRGKRRAVANEEEEEVRGNVSGSRRAATSLCDGGGEGAVCPSGSRGPSLYLAASSGGRRHVKRGPLPSWISPPRRAAAAPSNLQLGGGRRWRRMWQWWRAEAEQGSRRRPGSGVTSRGSHRRPGSRRPGSRPPSPWSSRLRSVLRQVREQREARQGRERWRRSRRLRWSVRVEEPMLLREWRRRLGCAKERERENFPRNARVRGRTVFCSGLCGNCCSCYSRFPVRKMRLQHGLRKPLETVLVI
jgi:hypothetical protein